MPCIFQSLPIQARVAEVIGGFAVTFPVGLLCSKLKRKRERKLKLKCRNPDDEMSRWEETVLVKAIKNCE